MKKLSSFAAICAATLFASLCVGLMTARPSIAQGAGSTLGKDVRVVNTTGEAVPVSVQGTHTVNVGNTPTVNVNSLPAVQVGNGAGNPVPVTVTNVPAVQSPEQTFTATTQLIIGSEQFSSPFVTAYTVPAGKRLLITYVNFQCPTTFAGGEHVINIDLPGQKRFNYFANKSFQGIDYGSESCEISADAGETVQMSVHKDVANPVGFTTFIQVRWTGHLVNVS